jgi:hypothetical protein
LFKLGSLRPALYLIITRIVLSNLSVCLYFMNASLFVPAVIIQTDPEDERKGLVEEGLEI